MIVFNEYNRLNISSAIALSRLLNTVNLHSSTAGNRRRISSMQSLLRSVNLVFECLVTRVETLTDCSLTFRRCCRCGFADFFDDVTPNNRLFTAKFLLDRVLILTEEGEKNDPKTQYFQ